MAVKHTREEYSLLYDAYDALNARFFESTLPRCVITLQHSRSCYGYYHQEKFVELGSGRPTHEIALNPDDFDRSETDVLATLLHEMCHCWQAEFGKPSRSGYHNKEWAEKMLDVGLELQAVGKPAGQQTGQKVSHRIVPTGAFLSFATGYLSKQKLLLFKSYRDVDDKKPTRNSKTKYTCPYCGQNAWAKPAAELLCGVCYVVANEIVMMLSDEDDLEER